MAYDDRYDDPRSREWRNRERLGARHDTGMTDRPDRDRDGDERYPGGFAEGYGSGPFRRRRGGAPSYFGSPGYDASFAGPRFDRADAGSTGTHGVHPVGSASGGAYRGFGSTMGSYRSSARRHVIVEQAENEQPRQARDPHYDEWRRRRIEELDRDYEEYCRDRQSRFHDDFTAFRERRGQQRESLRRVKEHMEVVGADGVHVGRVDRVEDDRIVLARNDEAAHGAHHSIPCSWVEEVGDRVRLNIASEQAFRTWKNEEYSRALFEREDQGEDGPHILNRSFAGTYSDDDR